MRMEKNYLFQMNVMLVLDRFDDVIPRSYE